MTNHGRPMQFVCNVSRKIRRRHSSVEKIFHGDHAASVAGLVFLFLGLSMAIHAQTAPSAANSSNKPQDPLNRDSPQSSVFSFLEVCHARNYERAWRYLDVRNLPPEQRLKDGPKLAQELAQVLDRDVQFDVASLSRDPEGNKADRLAVDREHIDSFTVNGKRLELQLARVSLPSGSSVWLFSSDSIALIPQLARMASDSPIEKHLPDRLVSWKLMDTPMWRWIALALLAISLAAISRWLSRLVLLMVEPVLKRIAPQMNRSVLEVFAGPLRLLLCVAGFRAGMEWVIPAALLRLALDRSLTFLFFLGLAWLCARIVDLVIGRLHVVLQRKHQTFSYSVLPLASRVLKLTILILMIAAILSDWGYNTTTILAGLGVGGLAIALAAQKTIENLFGGVAVISDRPVSVGDLCRFGDRVGTVEDIGLRSTRIRTLDRTLVTIPNAEFSSMTLENLSKRDKIWFHFALNLRRDTTPDQVRTLLESITKTLREHPRVETGPLPVRFIGVGTYSLDLEVFAYVLTKSMDDFLRIQQELLLWVLEAVEAAGTALALPTQASVDYVFSSTSNPIGTLSAQEVAPGSRR